MLGNDNQNNNGRLLILKIQTRDAEKHAIDPVFQISEKNQETKKWAVTNSTSSVSGDLVKLEVKLNTPKDDMYDPYESVSIYLKDSVLDETYLIDTRINMLSRSIFNSLLNLEEFGEIKIGLYLNKKGFATAAVRQHGNMVNWKFSLDQIPQPLEVQFKGKIQRDYTPTDSFFTEKLRELAARIAGVAPSNSEKPAAQTQKVAKPAPKVKKVEVVEPEIPVDDDESLF